MPTGVFGIRWVIGVDGRPVVAQSFGDVGQGNGHQQARVWTQCLLFVLMLSCQAVYHVRLLRWYLEW